MPQRAARPPRPSDRPRRVVITAGPTREYFDDVRFLTNGSTGRMGHALAKEAARRGAKVTLVIGPSDLPPLPGVRTVEVVTTEDLWKAAHKVARMADLVIFAAAPADFRPVPRRRGKPPREDGELTVTLRPTTDVAARLGRRKQQRVHVGFALEVTAGEHRARIKMARKGLDAIVLNGLDNIGAGGGKIWWVPRDGKAEALSSESKAATARSVIGRAWRLVAARRAGAITRGAR